MLFLPYLSYILLKSWKKEYFKVNILSRLGIIEASDLEYWIHGASLGESKITVLLSKKMPKNAKILTTSMTLTGYEMLKKELKEDRFTVRFIPLDVDVILKRLFSTTKDLKTLILVESEIWPNLINYAKAYGKNIVIVNGRMTEKAYINYKRLSLFKETFKLIDLVLARTEEDKNRFKNLGVKEVFVTGNIKFDMNHNIARIDKGKLGVPDKSPVFTLGSIREGEEAIIAEVISEVKRKIKNVFFIVAPRHPRKFNLDPFKNLKISLRSKGSSHQCDVLVLDTLGELVNYFSISDIAFVGGSILPYGGHNILEPISMGIPTLFGPYMENFSEEARIFKDGKGGVMVRDPKELVDWSVRLLKNENLRNEISQRGLKELRKHKGALDRTLKILEGKGYIKTKKEVDYA